MSEHTTSGYSRRERDIGPCMRRSVPRGGSAVSAMVLGLSAFALTSIAASAAVWASGPQPQPAQNAVQETNQQAAQQAGQQATGQLGEAFTERISGTTVEFVMRRIPAGTVEIDGEVHEIGPLYAAETETTWDMYDVFLYGLDQPSNGADDAVTRPSKPYLPPDRGFGHDGFPAISITYYGAQQFAAWLSEKTGRNYRLPTAEEWVYLARGGEDRAAFDTDAELGEAAWFAGNSGEQSRAVGKKQPNGYGLYDMLGNVAEFVVTDSRRPIAMGGSWQEPREDLTCTSRQRQSFTWNQSDPQLPKSTWWLADCSWVGWRLVMDPARQPGADAGEENEPDVAVPAGAAAQPSEKNDQDDAAAEDSDA